MRPGTASGSITTSTRTSVGSPGLSPRDMTATFNPFLRNSSFTFSFLCHNTGNPTTSSVSCRPARHPSFTETFLQTPLTPFTSQQDQRSLAVGLTVTPLTNQTSTTATTSAVSTPNRRRTSSLTSFLHCSMEPQYNLRLPPPANGATYVARLLVAYAYDPRPASPTSSSASTGSSTGFSSMTTSTTPTSSAPLPGRLSPPSPPSPLRSRSIVRTILPLLIAVLI